MSDKPLLQPPKGFRDFLPQEANERQRVTQTIIGVFARYGYSPLETPALEYASLLEGKYGEEEKLIFKFSDLGGREVALRYDQTVPLARVIAQNKQSLAFPFKRYQVQPAWRAEKPQSGRFREFLQCDIDIVGSHSPLADAEVIAVTNEVLEAVGFQKFYILVNDRRLLSRIVKTAQIKSDLETAVIRSLDKLEKIGEAEVVTHLESLGIPRQKIETLMQLLGRRPVLPKKKKAEVEMEEIETLMHALKALSVPEKRILYSSSLARGLDYYTGTIFEVTIEGYPGGSVAGGGRYDNLIGAISGKNLPAVGVAFGVDRLIEAMTKFDLLKSTKTQTRVLVTVMGEQFLKPASDLATSLRTQKLNTELYLNPSEKLSIQLRYASRKGIPFAVILGPEELETNTASVKDLRSGDQRTVPITELVTLLQS